MQSFDEFLSTRYWPQLDGLRTVSIALVVVIHMGDSWWIPYKGALAVVLFFVISGYLITALLIREERREGRASLRSFYIRRVFRIAPLYYVALGATTVLVAFGFGEGNDDFGSRLVFLATFNGDLTGPGTFVHSWSIGVEEKFYILWPIIGFAFLFLRRRRGVILATLAPAVAVAAYLPPVTYLGMYAGIVFGCCLAVALHTERFFTFFRYLATPLAGTILAVVAVLAFLFDWAMPLRDESGSAHVPFALAATLAFPAMIIGRGWMKAALAWKPLVFVGTRSYAIYLFHPLCIDLVGLLIPAGQSSPEGALVRFVMAALLSYLVAEVTFRLIERPLIRFGRTFARRDSAGSGPRIGFKQAQVESVR